MTSHTHRRSVAHDWIRGNVLGLVAIFIALNGTAVATQVASEAGQTKASAKSTAIKAAKKKVKRGPRGLTGPQGPVGPQGAAGPSGVGGPPSGAAGGELAGTYPNPTIGTVDGLNLGLSTAASPGVEFGPGPGTPTIYNSPGFPNALVLDAPLSFAVDAALGLNLPDGGISLPNATTAADGIVFSGTLGGSPNLYRSSASTLHTDGSYEASGSLTVGGNATLGDAATDTATINAGPVNLPNATAAADALTLGGDTNLYRASGNRLSTDDAFTANNMQLRLDQGFPIAPPPDSGQLTIVCNAGADALELVVLWPDGSTDSLALGSFSTSCL